MVSRFLLWGAAYISSRLFKWGAVNGLSQTTSRLLYGRYEYVICGRFPQWLVDYCIGLVIPPHGRQGKLSRSSPHLCHSVFDSFSSSVVVVVLLFNTCTFYSPSAHHHTTRPCEPCPCCKSICPSDISSIQIHDHAIIYAVPISTSVFTLISTL